MFNFGKSKISPDDNLAKQIEAKKDLAKEQSEVSVSESNMIIGFNEDNGVIQITSGDKIVYINTYELLFKRDHNGTDSKYRIMGVGNSMLVTEEELDVIYSAFKKFNV